MKKTILSTAIIATAFLAASCAKENIQESIAPVENASVFTATIENGASTKTTVERSAGSQATYKTKWESTDQISINGVTYTAAPDVTDATQATFTTTSGSVPTATFKAYFPANMYYSDSKAILSASYTYTDGKYNMPMYAQSETTSLSFKNLCGVLAITVNGTDFASVEKIEVFSDKQMNGEFSATAAGVLSFASVTLTDALKKVALEFTSAKTIASDGSATFYIPVPANTHNPLTIKVTGGSSTKIMVTKKSGGVAVERNKVYPITFDGELIAGTANANINSVETPVNWVRLWENGPKFAEYNVGATSATDYGGYYAWGGSQDKVDDHNTGTVDLSPTSNPITDTATKLWGSNWRMPNKTELIDLLSSCDVEWIDGSNKKYNNTNVSGLLCTGKGAYASNSVFLPAAGHCYCGIVYGQGDYGAYWSSTPYGRDYSFRLRFDSGGQYVDYFDHLGGCYSVRAVLAEFD